ncbi:trypsin-like peptidase domain-containing protein, partial [Arthrospira sp. PCC 8006]|uniref:trypsin-like peptidase domain-containing protein n=1 Tax=Arthrospira sp. PCC 8006 TaxID=1982224 RepID=UPI00396F3EBD
LALDPNDAIAHNNLGYALQQQGDLPGAIAEYKKAIRLDPNFAIAYSNLQEAERLLALRGNPLPANPTEILPSLQEQPLFGLQRSTVLIIAQTTTGAKTGTGWVVHREGNSTYIITNRHVVSDEDFGKRPSSDIKIELYSHNEPEHRLRFPARIRHITSPNDLLDLAVLEVTGLPDDIEPLRLSNSAIPLDADVRIIGHPVTGSSWTILRGYIAANTPEANQLNLQIGGTNLAVGNSGGAVIYDNQVVGLVTKIADELEAAAMAGGNTGASIGGFGFAYPVDVIRQQLQRWGLRF